MTPKDRETALERARKRRMNQLEVREVARQKLRAEEYMDHLHSGLDALRTGYEMRDGELVELTPKRTNQLKVAHEGYFKLLDRVLPPLKAVEITKDPIDPQDPTKMTSVELLKLLQMARRQQEPPIEAECTVVEPEPEPVKHRPKSPRHLPFG